MSIILDYRHAYKTSKQLISKYNDNPVIGKGDKPMLCKAGVEHTFERIVKMMGAYSKKHPKLFEDGYFPTSNGHIASYVRVSGRTIQNHLQVLQLAGLIIKPRSKWHGSTRGYEIALTPELYINTVPVDQQPTKNFPHKELGTLKNIEDTTNVSKVSGNPPKKGSAARTLEKINKSGNKGDKIKENFSLAVDQPELKGDKRRAKKPAGGRVALPMSFLQSYITTLLRICITDLYPPDGRFKYLAEIQIKIIRLYFFKKLQYCSESELFNRHLEFRTRLYMVKRWIDKEPDRFVPLPHIYFDCDSKINFDNTAEWYEHLKDLNTENARFRKRQKHFIRKRDHFTKEFKKYDSATLIYNVWQD